MQIERKCKINRITIDKLAKIVTDEQISRKETAGKIQKRMGKLQRQHTEEEEDVQFCYTEE